MKTNSNNLLVAISMALIFIFSVSETQAQPHWNRFLGDPITSSEFIGSNASSTVPLRIKTMSNYPIEIFTNNTERMRIDTNDNVGIGTATPAHTLDVNGTVAAKQILIEEKDILALLTELQAQIAELKKQFDLIKN